MNVSLTMLNLWRIWLTIGAAQRPGCGLLSAGALLLAFSSIDVAQAQVNLDCAPLALDASSVAQKTTVGAAGKKVAIMLSPGRLQPQIERILAGHFQIKLVDWRASPHHRWPTEYRLEAWSWAELLTRMLEPYGLRIVIHANHSAVIDYVHQSAEAV